MFIKNIIIEGFKSYGNRTEIKGFDPQFNAITGLNGTGKSNILDSICFVLGISNLTNVRARTLQDLIYKSGQAGITKASVTIVFDNKDSSRSPINYENYEEVTVTRQIVLGGKNRYLINGSTVTNKLVIDFFNSVQLNVNNPHFLIMQGRITKVLNMKPPEILSMIEEAAGTRMYENKKAGAQKTIEKKDTKLKEMDEMVNDQINPKLQKLKDERMNYMEFQRMEKEFDQANRIYTAWQFLQLEGKLEATTNELNELTAQNKDIKNFIQNSKEEITDLTNEIGTLQQKRDSESGGVLADLEIELKGVEKKEAKAQANVKNCKDNISSEKKKTNQMERTIHDEEKILASKKNELDKVRNMFESLKEAERKDEEALAASQNKFQAVSSGLLANEGGENATLQDQLMDARQQLSEAETTIKQLNMQIKHDTTELESKRPKLKKTEMGFAKDQKELQMKQKELSTLKEHLSKINYEDGKMETLHEQLREATAEMRRYQEAVGSCEQKLPMLSFHFRDPEPNFDRRRVKGLLLKLFSVKDPAHARALEAAAGSRLYNVVVDSDATAALILKKGGLVRRTTFAPLNKIQSSSMDPSFIHKAQNLVGPQNALFAKDLVSYDPVYESVINWVFGQVFVCPTMDAAEQICCNPGIRKKAITFEGDTFDPSGVVSGGAKEKGPSVLLELNTYMNAEQRLATKQAEIARLNEEIKIYGPISTNYEAMKQRYELREREIEMVQTRLQQTSHYQLQQEIQSLEESVASKEVTIKELTQNIKEKNRKVAELENKIKNMKSIRERELKDAEDELKKAKKRAEDSRVKWKQREQEYEMINLEIEELMKSVENGKEQLEANKEGITKYEQELEAAHEALKEAQANVAVVKEKVKAQKDDISQQNREIQKMNSKKEKLIKQIGEKELEILANDNLIAKAEGTIDQNKNVAAGLRRKYKWIDTDKEYFGKPNGMYDFVVHDPKEAYSKLKKLGEMKEKLGKSVNAKALEMLTNQEEQFQEVMNKKEIIEEDRSKILSVIDELDIKKEDVIMRAWDKVNHDFNSILSSLLPSAHAQLKPSKGKNFMEGLEVKVGFGGIWKESLDELSGGQRSLVALSLILAMLLFKPAPLYILDEVDAALDPSHTQNIGQMLKAHFKQSQFIIVSLKDGMFNNANVLFRTKFVDGMSAVTRTANHGKK